MNDENYALAAPNQSIDALTKLVDDSSSGFLLRLTQQYGESEKVKDDKAQAGEFWLGDRNLGKVFNVVVGDFRSHATVFENNALAAESFDASSEAFQRIQKKAARYEKGYASGPEFLVWLPDVGKYATWHFKRSTLKSAPEFAKARGKLVSASTKPVGKRKTKVPTILAVSDNPYEAPTAEQTADAIEQFNDYRNEKDGKAAGNRPR